MPYDRPLFKELTTTFVISVSHLSAILFERRVAMSSPENCHVCFSKGKTSRLRVYQINFDEAVRFCEDDKEVYRYFSKENNPKSDTNNTTEITTNQCQIKEQESYSMLTKY
uniref:Uncharacterized protein n=1 Tax=Magallana gigas TaxID=29159 RepID=K1RHX9_MAGGI